MDAVLSSKLFQEPRSKVDPYHILPPDVFAKMAVICFSADIKTVESLSIGELNPVFGRWSARVKQALPVMAQTFAQSSWDGANVHIFQLIEKFDFRSNREVPASKKFVDDIRVSMPPASAAKLFLAASNIKNGKVVYSVGAKSLVPRIDEDENILHRFNNAVTAVKSAGNAQRVAAVIQTLSEVTGFRVNPQEYHFEPSIKSDIKKRITALLKIAADKKISDAPHVDVALLDSMKKDELLPLQARLNQKIQEFQSSDRATYDEISKENYSRLYAKFVSLYNSPDAPIRKGVELPALIHPSKIDENRLAYHITTVKAAISLLSQH